VLAIVGLGNPGSEYYGTRHNIGFAVVDAIAEEIHVNFSPGNGDYLIGTERKNFLLVKPLTYMNNSGIAVKEVMESFDISINNIVVVVDDFHLPLGALRLRTTGSSGGHNGLSSIIRHLESEDFPRLRCGIGNTATPGNPHRTADFVLSMFNREEFEPVAAMTKRACDILRTAGEQSISSAISRLSRRRI
jgi:PTH1 family peptidyl-tRNA hydrolase